ncbi:MAG TPA: class I SAM-dependent methyltransferase [Candidatus Altiarchaeales archaeon]|nr:class I SAM-dependent methyltransferase [Candidatus Altiarchaeales archaeon]
MGVSAEKINEQRAVLKPVVVGGSGLNGLAPYELFSRYRWYGESTIKLLDFCRIKAGERVLDIGCGTGTSTKYILKRVGLKGSVVGLDVDERMLDDTRKKFGEDNVRFVAGDARDVARILKPGYDAVLCFNGMHLMRDPYEVCAGAHDVLKTGGVFGFNVGFFHGDAESHRLGIAIGREIFKVAGEKGLKKEDVSVGQRIRRMRVGDYEDFMAGAGFKGVASEIFEYELPAESLVIFFRTRGASLDILPDIDSNLRADILSAAARNVLEKNDLKSVRRNWLYVRGVRTV